MNLSPHQQRGGPARGACRRPVAWRVQGPQTAFTLLEVMIAMAIFFMAIFAILDLVSQNLKLARGLSMGEFDIGTVAAQIAQTNRLQEGSVSGDFGDFYPGASWTADIALSGTGGLYQADITVNWPQNGAMQEEKTQILLYRPDSPVRFGTAPR